VHTPLADMSEDVKMIAKATARYIVERYIENLILVYYVKQCNVQKSNSITLKVR
jgi:hypothetical protein